MEIKVGNAERLQERCVTAGLDRKRAQERGHGLPITAADLLFDIVYDWKGRRTITSHRILLSVCLVVFGMYFAGFDASNVSVFGIKPVEGDETRFIGFLIALVIGTFLYFENALRVDKSVKEAKLQYIKSRLDECVSNALYVKDAASRLGVAVSDIFDDLWPIETLDYDPSASYHLAEFYVKNLRDAERGDKKTDTFDVVLVRIGALAATLCLVDIY